MSGSREWNRRRKQISEPPPKDHCDLDDTRHHQPSNSLLASTQSNYTGCTYISPSCRPPRQPHLQRVSRRAFKPDSQLTRSDQLNRYRLTHPDKELRWVIRRLNRLPYIDTVEAITAVAADGQAPDAAALASAAADRAAETELARLDLDKWRLGVDRTLASVRNFQRQRESYLRKVGEAGGYLMR